MHLGLMFSLIAYVDGFGHCFLPYRLLQWIRVLCLALSLVLMDLGLIFGLIACFNGFGPYVLHDRLC